MAELQDARAWSSVPAGGGFVVPLGSVTEGVGHLTEGVGHAEPVATAAGGLPAGTPSGEPTGMVY